RVRPFRRREPLRDGLRRRRPGTLIRPFGAPSPFGTRKVGCLHRACRLHTTKAMNAPVQPPEFTVALYREQYYHYDSREDPRIATDLARAKALVDQMNAWQGRLAALSGAELGRALDQAIGLYEQAADVMGALGAYAFLAASTNREDAAAQGFEADVRE